jgi:hypothetical protein
MGLLLYRTHSFIKAVLKEKGLDNADTISSHIILSSMGELNHLEYTGEALKQMSVTQLVRDPIVDEFFRDNLEVLITKFRERLGISMREMTIDGLVDRIRNEDKRLRTEDLDCKYVLSNVMHIMIYFSGGDRAEGMTMTVRLLGDLEIDPDKPTRPVLEIFIGEARSLVPEENRTKFIERCKEELGRIKK